MICLRGVLGFCLLTAAVASGYRIGLLSDESVRGLRFSNLVQTAVEDVAADVPIELVYNNTRATTSGALFTTTWQLQYGNILATVGPVTTQEMSPVAVSAASYNVPCFTPAASSEYSDKILYPNVFRARSTDDDYAYAMVALVNALGTTVVGVISSSDIYGNGLLNTLSTMKPAPSFQIHVSRYSPSPDPNAYQSILAALTELKNQGIRVFVYHGAPNNLLMMVQASNALGLTNNADYQIIFNPELAAAVQSNAAMKAEWVKGILGFPLHLPVDTARYKDLYARAKARWPVLFAVPPNLSELMGYEAIMGYATAIKQLRLDGKDVTPANIASALAKAVYTGITGEIQFNAKLTRQYPHDIWSWYGDGLAPVVVGYFDRAPGLTLHKSKIVWPGGASDAIWDGFSLRNMQELPVDITGALSALSFFVAMLSAWCCLVLIEQATYGVTRRMRVWHWTLLTGTLWGVCGIWGSSLVAFGSMSFPQMDHPPLHPGTTMGAFAVAVVTGVGVFFLGLTGVKQLHIDAVKAAKGNTYSTSTPAGDADTSVTRSSQRQGSTTQVSSAKASSQLEAEEENKKARAQFTTLHKKINRWLLAATLVQVAGSSGVLVMLNLNAGPGWLKWSPGVGIPLGSVVINILFSFLGLLFTFHFLPVTPIRSIGALPMTCSIFIHSQILMGGTRWLYKLAGAAGDYASYWAYDKIALAIAIVTVAMCMGLIAYNVFSMKLSRNSLDVHMAQFKKQFRQLIDQVDAYKALTMKKEKEREQLWRMMELISLGRPLGREHALAVALSDFVQDPLQNGQLLPVTVTVPQDKDKEKQKEEEMTIEQTLNRPKREETSIMHTYEKLIKVQNSSVREMRLEDLVAHPVTCELLKDAMAKHHDVESLMLYMDIQQFKKIENPKVRTFMAREIYDCFLAQGAKYEVNVSDVLRRPFHQRFGFDKGQLSPAMETMVPQDFFLDVEREMRNLLQTNGMARLQSSGMDQLCGQLLRMLKVPVKSSSNNQRDTERQSSPSPARNSVFDSPGRASPLVTISQNSSARGIAHVSHRPLFAPSPTVEPAAGSPPPETTIAWAPPV